MKRLTTWLQWALLGKRFCDKCGTVTKWKLNDYRVVSCTKCGFSLVLWKMLFLLLLTVTVSAAPNVWLIWEPTETPGVQNYRVYIATFELNQTNYDTATIKLDAGTQLAIKPNGVEPGTKYWACVTAWLDGLESEISNVISFVVPKPPRNTSVGRSKPTNVTSIVPMRSTVTLARQKPAASTKAPLTMLVGKASDIQQTRAEALKLAVGVEPPVPFGPQPKQEVIIYPKYND